MRAGVVCELPSLPRRLDLTRENAADLVVLAAHASSKYRLCVRKGEAFLYLGPLAKVLRT